MVEFTARCPAYINYQDLQQNFLEIWCPEHILQPTLEAYVAKRRQRRKESVKEFAEAFTNLLSQLEPPPSVQKAISMFEDRLHEDLAAALAGDRFDTLQEAIDKAQTVEEKASTGQ